MKDPKAIRRAIMAAKSIAAMVDPHFARVPLPDLGEPAPDMAMPEPEPQQFSMGGSASKRSDDPFAKFHSQDPWLRRLPDHQYATGGEVDDHVVNNPMSVFPKPQRMWDEDMPGGAYLSMPDKADVTGHRAAQASIGIGEGGKPYFHASRDEVDETGTPGKGSALVKTNLFKQKAGWRWLQAPEGHDDTGTIVSVEHRGNHHYVMDAHFPNGVDLSRYPDSPSEPRLRPTTRGNVELGPQVGSILVRGREHPVHSHAIVREYGGRVGYADGGMPDDDTPDYAAPDDMGLYSHAAATAASLPQAKASPAEFRGMLANKFVKPVEFEASGYDQAFADQPQITREQVAAHFHENKTPIEEKVLRDKPSKEDMRKVTEAHKIRSMDYHDRANEAMAAGLSGEFDPGSHEYAQMSRDYQRERMELKDKYGKPQYEDYTIPGGENYREILLKHKRDDAAFSSNHFNDEPNILTHLRMKDRYDTDNFKILHLDELQSDWAQQGRKEGFAGGVKAAPYVTSTNDWVDLGLKRALLEAAKGGHDKLAWTQGKEAADRYDLSKHIAKIDYIKHPDRDTGYLLAHGHDRPNIISQPVAVKDLPDMIGKDVAEKLLAATPETNGEQNTHSLEGLDLKVGGEGMRKFYDDILPKRLMRLAKTHDPDAKLSSSTINHPMDFDEEEQPDDDQTNLHALEITPRMRESILKKGFAAYASGGAVGEAQDADEQPDMLQLPVAKIFQIISMAGSGDPAADPEKFKEYLKKAQYALARKTTTKGSDVLKASPGAANVKMSEFGKPLEEMESTTVSKGMMLPRKEADLEAMQRRKARIFPFLGDMSPADRILLKSGSLALVDPSEQQGGSDFMRSEFAKGIDPAAYGNRIGAAKTLAKKIASQTPEGTPAVGTHVAMGLGSVDSSHHAYEPILRMIPNSPIAQRHIEEFDDMMHEALPPSNKYPMAWPGIMNTKEAEQFFASRPGTHASFFAKKIDSSKWQKAGFPDIGEMRFSASNPEILGNPRMSTGHAFSEVEPSGRVIESPDLKHRTYPALIPAEGEGYLGGSSVPIPPKLMFRDFYKSLKTKDRSGKAIDYDSPSGQTLAQQSLMTKVPYQDATQEWLDNIMEDRRQKQEQGFKKGGKVRSALMIAKGMKNR